MMRSMFSGISGLKNHQLRMDVIGNNIANVNTLAFKSSRVTFQEVFNQTLQGASAPTTARGGTDPLQVGLGMSIGSIDMLGSPGSIQNTGLMTDMAIQGDGYFVVSDAEQKYYTRAGDFKRDANGYLVTAQGFKVMGWVATGGVFGTKNPENLTNLNIPIGQSMPACASSRVLFGRNLDCNAALGSVVSTPVDLYDSLGNLHSITVSFTKVDTNEWSWNATGAGVSGGDFGTIVFDPQGSFVSSTGGPVTIDVAGADSMVVALKFDAVTQSASSSGASTAEVISTDGYPAGQLTGFSIDPSGIITGSYSNGISQPLAQVALAYFANPGGLVKSGEGVYRDSPNSGVVQIGEPGTAGRGLIAPASLEMSNIDLASEFTNLIITQRGFQANSRIITTSDEMLQELANLKR